MHMMLWIEHNPNPEQLCQMMHADPVFQENVLSWLEDLIKCELPGETEVQLTEVEKPQQ